MSVSPRQSVEAVFDPATDEEVLRRWQVLADAGLPSQLHHRGLTNWPHLTLSVAQSVPPATDEALADLVARGRAELPLPCRLGPLVVLGGRRLVLAHLVVPSVSLLRVHVAIAEVMAGAHGLSDLTRPGRWTPHVTLARGVDRSQLAPALEALGRLDELESTLTGVRRWDPLQRRAWAITQPEGVPRDVPTDVPTMGR